MNALIQCAAYDTIILMETSPRKVVSPERSRSIKLKVSNKAFPLDFFKRSCSQSPNKQVKNVRYSKQSPEKSKNPQLAVKSQQYWDLMREELQNCRFLSDKEKVKQAQRIWVYSEKKSRSKHKQAEVRFESRQENRNNIVAFQIAQPESPPRGYNCQLKEGLFTFFNKSPTKALNLVLPPLKHR